MATLIRRATLILALATYFASMFVPLFGSWADIPGEEGGWMPGFIGLFAVFFVWDHEFGPLLFLSWFANPAFWFGFYLLIVEKPARSALAGSTSIVLGLLVLACGLRGPAGFPAYWTWLGSFAVLAVGSRIYEIGRRREIAAAAEVDHSVDVDDRIRRL